MVESRWGDRTVASPSAWRTLARWAATRQQNCVLNLAAEGFPGTTADYCSAKMCRRLSSTHACGKAQYTTAVVQIARPCASCKGNITANLTTQAMGTQARHKRIAFRDRQKADKLKSTRKSFDKQWPTAVAKSPTLTEPQGSTARQKKANQASRALPRIQSRQAEEAN